MTEAQQAHAGNRPSRKAPPKGRTKAGKGRKSAPPITAHPLFPAIVALWFAAAFGLGSLAIRPGLLEGLVLSLGIDTIIPAAAPPLGVTARILLALGLGAFGAVLGTLLARRLNRAPKQRSSEAKPRSRKVGRDRSDFAARSRDAHPDAPVRRPIFAHEELGDDGLGDAEVWAHEPSEPLRPAAQPIPGRRRALAIEDESPRDFHELAPLPGGEPLVLDIGAFAIDDQPAPAAPEAPAELDLAAFAPPPPPPPVEFESVRLGPAQADGTAVPFAVAAQAPQTEFAEDLPRVPEGAIVPQPRFDRPGGVFDIPAQAPRLFSRPADTEEPLADIVISPPEEAVAETPVEEPAPAQPQAEPARFTLPEGTAAARLQGAQLGALSHVELIERLALSLKHRRDQNGDTPAEAQAPASAPPVEAMAFVPPAAPQQAIEVAEAPKPVPAPPPLPAALRPVAFDEPFHDPAEDFIAHLPLRHLAMPAAAAEPEPEPEPEPAAEAEAEAMTPDEGAAEVDESGYSSLLDLRLTPAPARGGMVRIEEPQPLGGAIEPVVIFPGHAAPAAVDARPAAASEESAAVLRRFDAPGSPGVPSQSMAASPPPPNPEETERALRAALASLQRMSGAA